MRKIQELDVFFPLHYRVATRMFLENLSEEQTIPEHAFNISLHAFRYDDFTTRTYGTSVPYYYYASAKKTGAKIKALSNSNSFSMVGCCSYNRAFMQSSIPYPGFREMLEAVQQEHVDLEDEESYLFPSLYQAIF